MIRRYGETPDPDMRYGHRPGAYAILPLGGQILLTWQGGIHDEFQLPGGGIDPGESTISALHREVYEETGWRIAAPRRVGAHRRFVYMPEYDRWAEKVAHIYIARPVRPLGPPTEAEHEAVWMPVELAAELIAAQGDADLLRSLIGG